MPRNEVDCPFRDNGVEYAVPSDEFGPDEVPIRLERSTETVGLPRDDVSFTLRNGTDRVFNTNFYSWAIWKRVDGEWFHVLPRMTNDPLNPMEPGDEHTWTVEVDNGEEVGPVEGTDSVTMSGLGGGEYVFETDGWFEGRGYEEKTGFCARFEVEGSGIELTPTENAEAERDGDAVVVTDDSEGTEDTRFVALVVERVDETEDAERMIPEQAIRGSSFANPHKYRNTLPFFEEGVKTVRYETYGGTHPPFGVQGSRVIEYEGGFYGVSAEELER